MDKLSLADASLLVFYFVIIREINKKILALFSGSFSVKKKEPTIKSVIGNNKR